MNSSWYVPPKTEIQAVSKQFSSCLINGHYKQANLISRMLITQQWSPAVVYLNIIRKTLNQIGNLWHQGKLLITEEHRATQFWLLLMDRVRNTFKRYVSESIVEQIIDDKLELGMGGKLIDVTVLFADIRGFTALSEKIEPEAVVELLNKYFTEMIENFDSWLDPKTGVIKATVNFN